MSSPRTDGAAAAEEAEKEAAVQGQHQCPGGHFLRCRGTAPLSSWQCDGCNRGPELLVTPGRWQCHRCNFDLCDQCLDKLGLRQPQDEPQEQPDEVSEEVQEELKSLAMKLVGEGHKWSTRQEAVNRLLSPKGYPPGAIASAVFPCLKSKDWKVRKAGWTVILSLPSHHIQSTVEKCLEDTDAAVRSDAVLRLADVAEKSTEGARVMAVSRALTLAADEAPEVREAVALTLGRIGEQGESDCLLAALTALSDNTREVQLAAIDAVNQLAVPDIGGLTVKVLNWELHKAGSDAAKLGLLSAQFDLLLLGDKSAMKDLARSIEDPSPEVRLQAIRLAHQASKLHPSSHSYLPQLRTCFRDPNAWVREAAATALNRDAPAPSAMERSAPRNLIQDARKILADAAGPEGWRNLLATVAEWEMNQEDSDAGRSEAQEEELLGQLCFQHPQLLEVLGSVQPPAAKAVLRDELRKLCGAGQHEGHHVLEERLAAQLLSILENPEAASAAFNEARQQRNRGEREDPDPTSPRWQRLAKDGKRNSKKIPKRQDSPWLYKEEPPRAPKPRPRKVSQAPPGGYPTEDWD